MPKIRYLVLLGSALTKFRKQAHIGSKDYPTNFHRSTKGLTW